MIFIDMTSFPGSRDESRKIVQSLLAPYLKPEDKAPHNHQYAIALLDLEGQAAVELHTFEAPCVVSDEAGNIRGVITALREAASDIESGHADILESQQGKGDVPAHVLVDLLGLVGVTVTEGRALGWDLAKRREAYEWASATHLSASDNDVEVPDRPAFLDTMLCDGCGSTDRPVEATDDGRALVCSECQVAVRKGAFLETEEG